jgi:signal transduction histidine kinase
VTLRLEILPPWWGTTSFRSASAVALVALLWALYRFRVRQLHHQFDMMLEGRIGERVRIARELHDTLLQSFQGVLLRFESVLKALPPGADEARARLERALDQAEAAVTEGRDAVQGLRRSAVTINALADGIAAIGAELTSGPSAVDPPVIQVGVEGKPRNLNPVVRDEAYRISGEALRNAFNHAAARHIVVTIRYDARELRVSVRDDGKGMDGETIKRQHAAGHFGLPGMRERAAVVRGRLDVRSAVGAGSEVELRVPGAIAYRASTGRSWSRLFRRTSSDG